MARIDKVELSHFTYQAPGLGVNGAGVLGYCPGAAITLKS